MPDLIVISNTIGEMYAKMNEYHLSIDGSMDALQSVSDTQDTTIGYNTSENSRQDTTIGINTSAISDTDNTVGYNTSENSRQDTTIGFNTTENTRQDTTIGLHNDRLDLHDTTIGVIENQTQRFDSNGNIFSDMTCNNKHITNLADCTNAQDAATQSYVDSHGVVQMVNTQTGTVSTGTTAMPRDNSIPQNTEGDEYMTLAITPTNASNKLNIRVVLNGAVSTDQNGSMALFQDATAGALSAVTTRLKFATPDEFQLIIDFTMTAGTTDETTFKIRAGVSSSGTFTFNGGSIGQNFGGVNYSSITITEIKS